MLCSSRAYSVSSCFLPLTVLRFPGKQNVLGDNPAVSSGAPIAIDWKHDKKEVVGVDHHEYLRRSQPRRTRKGMIMSGAERDT